MTPVRVVLVTAPSEQSAAGICEALLSEGLVACGNILSGVRSLYRWEGRVEDEPEVLVVLKTVSSSVPALLRRIPELHPYEVPEILTLQVETGHPPYLEWVAGEVASEG